MVKYWCLIGLPYLRSDFRERVFFPKINQPVDHEPVDLKKNEFPHEIQRGRIGLDTDFEGIHAVFQ